jgi:hypothetical protein
VSVAVITSWYGNGQDRIGPQPPQSVDAEWILVTDQPVESDLWRVVHEPRPELGPRMAAKLAKFRPDFYTNAYTTVWLDAAARFKDEDGLARLIDWSAAMPLSQFPHPARRCLYDEAAVSTGVWKYQHQNLAGQMMAYKEQGMPLNWGLWATGVIVRNGPRSLTRGFDDGWLAEQFRFTDQDQVSEPYVAWRTGVRPHDLPFGVFDNPAVAWDYAGRRW